MLPMVQSEPVLFKCGAHSVNTATSPPTTLPPSLTPESDVDELVDIFFDVDVAATTYPRIESCDLQLGDTWRGMQGKMSVTALDKKIRKKSDKPQAQINKCYNEKRRRDQENETINQLEELLGTCLAEVKQPDKNGIVREATRQIQEVLQRRRECTGECPLRAAQSLSPVQAGEVSSTQPQPPCTGIHYTELTNLIEALKHYTTSLGWILLEINSKGEIECVTENIKDLTLRDRTELYKKSIFSLLHVKDHAKLKPLLKSVQNFNWSAGEIDRFQAIQAGFVVKNSNGTETSVVESVIHAAPVRGSASEEAGSVMCVIRRCEDASAALIPVGGAGAVAAAAAGGPPAISGKHADHIVFRLDCDFTILSCDLSGVENLVNSPNGCLVGTRYLELVESADRGRVAAHLAEAACLPAPPAISEPFRLRFGADRTLRVSARSRLFRAKPSSGEPDFIMSTHSVLDDGGDDERPASAPAPAPAAPDAEPRYPAHAHHDPPFSINDFDEPWLLAGLSEESRERRDAAAGEVASGSRAPLAPPDPHPHSHPHPHAHHEEQPVTGKLRSILIGKPEHRILIGILRHVEDEENASGDNSAPNPPHTPQPPHTPSAVPSPTPRPQFSHGGPASHSHQHGSLSHVRGCHAPQMQSDNAEEESDEARRGGGSSRASERPQSALLSQLLQPTHNGPGHRQDGHDQSYIEKMNAQKRKFEEAKGTAPNAKRATPENQQVSSSALPPTAVPTASASPATSDDGMSQLCKKNQILVKLLASEQRTPITPPQLGNPGVRPVLPRARQPHPHPHHQPPPQPHPHPHHQPSPPQPHPHPHHQPRQTSALSDILTGNHRMSLVNGASGASGSQLQSMLQGGGGARYPPPHYPARPYPQPHQPHHHNPGSRSTAGGGGDGEVPNADKALSDLLDEVIENMPDSLRQRQEIEDRSAAVKAITASLMQCETVQTTQNKHPSVSSPGTPPVYSVQSPGPCPIPSASGSGSGMYPSRAPTSIAEHHARLLHRQLSTQMLVSPEAAEQPQSDMGSTINALEKETPPNVTLLPRGDYHSNHPNIYQPNQMGSNYGTIKLTSSQNSMLSRQLSQVGGSGGYVLSGGVATHAAAALHTPLTPQPQPHPYHRAPRPHLVGGYYEEGPGGDCGEYARMTPHAPHAPHLPHAYRSPGPMHCPGNGSPGLAGGGGAGGAAGTSEYVRNELRAVVGARSARPDLHSMQPPDMDSLMTYEMAPPEYYGSGLGGGGGGGR